MWKLLYNTILKKLSGLFGYFSINKTEYEIEQCYDEYCTAALESSIQYKFKDPSLLKEALTHPSYRLNITNKKRKNYERLEFLGDKVFNLIIANLLYMKYPDMNEGQISIMQAYFVKSESLANMVRKLQLEGFIVMDKSEIKSGGRQKMRNLENFYEALIGAIFLDSGYDAACKIVSQHWCDQVNSNINYEQMRDYKSKLQELTQKNNKSIPTYKLISKQGIAHEPTFEIMVELEGISAYGKGRSKKVAEQNAASALYYMIVENKLQQLQ